MDDRVRGIGSAGVLYVESFMEESGHGVSLDRHTRAKRVYLT